MKKVLMILICLNFGFGFNTKDANESIDNFAYKSKIMTDLVNNFLVTNQPKIEAFKNEMIKSFFDLNQSISSFGSDLGKELLDMQKKFYESFDDMNLSSFKNNFFDDRNFKKDDFLNSFNNNSSMDEIKQIINIKPNLLTSASLINENGDIQLNLEGNEKLNQDEFEEIAKKSIDLIKENHKNIEKIRIDYINEKSKFSKIYSID